MELIYIAQPIDQDNGNGILGVLRICDTLNGAGYHLYRPAHAFKAGHGTDPRIDQINREALSRADCLVAILPRGISTIGVPMEIESVVSRGIPAVVLTDVASQSLAGHPLITTVATVADVLPAVRAAIQAHPRVGQHHQLRMVLRDGARMPTRAFHDDAGVDLTCYETIVVEPGTFVDIPTQVVGVQTPPDTWLMITGRSSTLRQRQLHIPVAVIDPGWRGPLYVGVWNLSGQPVKVEAGDRLAQLIALHNRTATVELTQVAQVDDHMRGTNGFGSTGN